MPDGFEASFMLKHQLGGMEIWLPSINFQKHPLIQQMKNIGYASIIHKFVLKVFRNYICTSV